MRKLHLNPEDLRVESFTTTDAERARRGTVHAQSRIITHMAMESCGTDECDGYSSKEGQLCHCDTTHTQFPPECEPITP